MATARATTLETTALASEVEGMLDSTEPDGEFRDSRECGAGLLLAALLLISPPSPRPKTENG